jgi:hypothetical protein
MDREHVKGFAEKAKGAIKEGAPITAMRASMALALTWAELLIASYLHGGIRRRDYGLGSISCEWNA